MSVVLRSFFLALFVSVAGCGDDDEKTPAPPTGGAGADNDAGNGLCTSCGACPETLPIRGFTHVTGRIEYEDTPPASGNHNGRCWSDWGVIETEVPPERWVHNLEHGGVVFLYRCDDGCDADLSVLREIVKAHPRTLLTSYAPLPTKFAVVAWGVRLLSDCVDRRVFEGFYDMHVAHGRENIDAPPPAECARAADPLAL